jgi:hypothetical protein
VRESSERGGLTLKPLNKLRTIGQCWTEEFDRNTPPQGNLASFPNHPHTTTSQNTGDFIPLNLHSARTFFATPLPAAVYWGVIRKQRSGMPATRTDMARIRSPISGTLAVEAA